MVKKEKMKYTLPFVLEGKPFELGRWTTLKQEEVFKETTKYENDLNEKELDKKYREILILKGLHEVDPNVTGDDLKDMHPDDLLALFTAVYLQGKRGILAVDNKSFRKKGTKDTASEIFTK
jgi:agmatine/peptidylarginine deiminase